MRTFRSPFGLMFTCTMLGLALGIISAKIGHTVEGMIVGPILGALAGVLLERVFATNRRWLLGLPIFETIFAVVLAVIVLLPVVAWLKAALRP